MDDNILVKIEKLKEIYGEFLEQLNLYGELENNLKKTAFFASQKKAEEVIEYSIKINREILKKKKIFPMSYKESFLKLLNLGFDDKFVSKLSDLAYFRNRLAHDYLVISDKEILEDMNNLKILIPKYLKKLLEIV